MRKTRINQGAPFLIADDLSGACDCAVEFLAAAHAVTVRTGAVGTKRTAGMTHAADPARHPEKQDSGSILAINTESRHAPARTAINRARHAAALARDSGAWIILKKTDSAFRGNYRTELAAVVDEIKPRAVVVAPAIPDFGRTTIGGVQHIDGIPIAESFYAGDPRDAIQTSSVLSVIGDSLAVSAVSLDGLRSRRLPPRTWAAATDRDRPVYVVDGEVNSDLDATVQLFLGKPGSDQTRANRSAPVLFVGGQGIAAALARRLAAATPPMNQPRSAAEPPAGAAPAEDRSGGALLVVCGSLHPVARRQLDFLLRRRSLDVLHPYDRSSSEVARELGRMAESSTVAVLATDPSGKKDADRLEKRIGSICRVFAESTKTGAIFLTGGSTAFSVLGVLGVDQIRILGKLADGTVLGEPVDIAPGGHPGLRRAIVCIKGGSLGPEDVMERFVNRFAGKS